jgi:hypothetical protein
MNSSINWNFAVWCGGQLRGSSGGVEKALEIRADLGFCVFLGKTKTFAMKTKLTFLTNNACKMHSKMV